MDNQKDFAAQYAVLHMVVKAMVYAHPKPELVRSMLRTLAHERTGDDVEELSYLIDMHATQWLKVLTDVIEART